MMIRLASFRRDQRGATAAEFAMIIPVALLFLLGMIDLGRFMWRVNQIEKGVQMGTRYAVATEIIPVGLNTATYAGIVCNGTALVAGDTICREALGVVTCTKPSASVSCSCSAATGQCPSLGTPNPTAWNNIVRRVRFFAKGVPENTITIRYSGSGIGYVGDPSTTDTGGALSDVAPIVTVEIVGAPFRSFSLLGRSLRLPRSSYSLTLEDGEGAVAN